MAEGTYRDLNQEFEEAMHTPSNLPGGGGDCSNAMPIDVPMITLALDQLDALINHTVEKILVERARVPISIPEEPNPEVIERVEKEENAQRRRRGDRVHNRISLNPHPNVVPRPVPPEEAWRRAPPCSNRC